MDRNIKFGVITALGLMVLAVACALVINIMEKRNSPQENVRMEPVYEERPQRSMPVDVPPVTEIEQPRENVPPVADACVFGEQLPEDLYVYAAGAYKGKDLPFSSTEGSKHTMTEMFINVHEPTKPVALILGAYDPVIWQIRWSKETRLAAVYISGSEPQYLSGLPPDIPVIISDSGSCGRDYVSEMTLDWINPMSVRLFGKKADGVYVTGRDGFINIGRQSSNIEYFNEYAKTSDSYRPEGVPLPGRAGIRAAIEQGIIRRANGDDYETLAAILNQDRNIPPVHGVDLPKHPALKYFRLNNAYVIMKPFTIPDMGEIVDAHFILLKGVPYPQGSSRHIIIFDLNRDGRCTGFRTGCDLDVED